MATITKPTAPGWQSVKAHYQRAKARNVSPFTFQAQTYIHQGERWVFELTLPPLRTTATALSWMAFLRDLAKGDNTFSLAVANYVPSDVTSPMTVRLADAGNAVSWDIDTAKFFGFSFTVEQVIS